MSIERVLYALIRTAQDAPDRVYALRAPQNGSTPYIIFQRVDTTSWRDINGPAGIEQATFQIDVYSTGYYEAKTLGDAIKAVLDGYRGDAPYGSDSPPDTIKIGGISFQNALDILDDTAEPYLYRNAATYLLTYHQG